MAWGNPSKLRVAQRLAGALGYLALAHSDRLHVTTLHAKTQRPFGPAQGKGRMVELLRYISNIAPASEIDLAASIEQLARQHQRGGIVVICSDLLLTQNLEAGLARLVPPRWQVVVLHLLDPQEMQPGLLGPIELEDSETGQRLPITVDEALLSEYRQTLKQWHEGIAAACARRGATYARLLTSWPLERKVVPYLRARRLLT